MNVEDSYRELGLTPESTDAEVKAAWRRLAARWHPDRNASPHALRKIQRINRALEEIRRFRESSFGPMTDFDTGAAAAEARAAPDRTFHHTIRLTLEQALAGSIQDIEGEIADECAACAGSGLQKHPSRCPECAGAGKVRQQLWFSWISPEVQCRACGGRGAVRQPCTRCEGTGKAPARRYRCRARIPPGVREGDLLHVSAHLYGHVDEKVPLSLRVELVPHEFFTLEPDGTVRCELPVDGFAWIANRWIEVPTPAGLQQMRLRRGYHTYRIKGQGFPTEEPGVRADCIVTVAPLFPEEFSKAQEARIDQLIAGNTKAAGTSAGKRTAAWQKALKAWRERLAAPKGDQA